MDIGSPAHVTIGEPRSDIRSISKRGKAADSEDVASIMILASYRQHKEMQQQNFSRTSF
jgi:hypothetical protein